MRTKVGAVGVGRVLMAALFLFAGTSKLRALPEMAATFEKLGGPSFMYFVGACETAGGIGILVPRSAASPRFALRSSLVGTALSHVFMLGIAKVGPALVALCVCSWAAYELRDTLPWAQPKA